MNPQMKEELLKLAKRVDVICIAVIALCLIGAAYFFVTERSFQPPPAQTAPPRQFQTKFPTSKNPAVESASYQKLMNEFVNPPASLAEAGRLDRLQRMNLFFTTSAEDLSRMRALHGQRLTQAQTLDSNGDRAAALAIVESVLEEDPNNAQAQELKSTWEAAAVATPEPVAEVPMDMDGGF